MVENATLDRLEDQISWYDKRSHYNQIAFKTVKMLEICAAAVVAGGAAVSLPILVISSLGMGIVVLEGVQHLNQYQNNWISYRSTCEALKHEKYLYLGSAGPYGSAEDRMKLLAERIEGLVSQEHAKWISTRTEAPKSKAEQQR
jgi:hypothetical protein